MLRRAVKLLVVWNIILTTLLLASLGANAMFVQASNDPPVQVFTADLQNFGGDNSSTTSTIAIDQASPIQLTTVKVKLSSDHNHVCLVSATAGLEGRIAPTQASNVIFGLSMDTNTPTDPASDRRTVLETSGVRAGTGSTTLGFNNLRGVHNFYFSGRLVNTQFNDPADVKSASMIVVCLVKRI